MAHGGLGVFADAGSAAVVGQSFDVGEHYLGGFDLVWMLMVRDGVIQTVRKRRKVEYHPARSDRSRYRDCVVTRSMTSGGIAWAQ